ncbi:MAG: HEAT repeat domain-containing protein [Ktedonobacterales bacterium]
MSNDEDDRNKFDDPAKRAELVQTLGRLRHGQLVPVEVPGALLDFGKAKLVEARPDVEALLTDADPAIRATALQVLTLDFARADDLRANTRIARQFLLEDPDPEARAKGASAFGWLLRNSQDRDALTLLASVVRNEQEVREVREAAYLALLSITRFNPRQHLKFVSYGLDLHRDVDWALVDSFLSGPRAE